VDQALHGGGEGHRVPGRDLDDVVADDLRDGGDLRGDDRAAAGHRLERREAEALVGRGEGEGEGAGQDGGQLAVGDIPEEAQARGASGLGDGAVDAGLVGGVEAAHEDKIDVGEGGAGEGVDEGVDVLAGVRGADMHEVGALIEVPGAEDPRGSVALGARRGGAKQVEVDAEGDGVDARGRDPEEPDDVVRGVPGDGDDAARGVEAEGLGGAEDVAVDGAPGQVIAVQHQAQQVEAGDHPGHRRAARGAEAVGRVEEARGEAPEGPRQGGAAVHEPAGLAAVGVARRRATLPGERAQGRGAVEGGEGADVEALALGGREGVDGAGKVGDVAPGAGVARGGVEGRQIDDDVMRHEG
jgi:hypothetical protein